MVNITNECVEPKILLVSCADSIKVVDKSTFDSCEFKGIHVTFWMEDEEDVVERTNRMFDALFNETEKSLGKISV